MVGLKFLELRTNEGLFSGFPLKLFLRLLLLTGVLGLLRFVLLLEIGEGDLFEDITMTVNSQKLRFCRYYPKRKYFSRGF